MNNTLLPNRKAAFNLRRAETGRKKEVDTDTKTSRKAALAMVVFGVVLVCAFSTAAFGQTNSLKPQCRRDRKFSDL